MIQHWGCGSSRSIWSSCGKRLEVLHLGDVPNEMQVAAETLKAMQMEFLLSRKAH